jgi:asparagine synthetase B (glutamine-hydrolysing)
VTLCRSPFELSELELASGLVFGSHSRPAPVPEPGEPHVAPLEALQAAVLPALARGRCFVSFSGGRDSSAVLAAAVSAARREGLPVPVPVTNIFPDAPRSTESEWQELVVTHLGLTDWVRIELHEELDCVGPLARGILERHGLLWPFNAHFHAPMLEVARGGTLLTGVGGDELLGTSHWTRAATVLSGAARPQIRDVARVGLAMAPYGARRRLVRARIRVSAFSWLTERANRELRSRYAEDVASEPRRWRDRRAWWCVLRATGIGLHSLELIAQDHGAEIEHPLTDVAFAASIARTAEEERLHERTPVLLRAFSSVLPSPVLERGSKAAFDSVFFGRESQALAKTVGAELEDLGAVEHTALQREWLGASPDSHSFLLLQAAQIRAADAPRNLHFGTVAGDPSSP